MATKETIAGALRLMREAKARLDNSKWVNRAPSVSHGEHCSITPMTCGRIHAHANIEIFSLATCVFMHEAQKICYVPMGAGDYCIPRWNDRRDRTREQVELAYERTIQRLENAVPEND